MPIKIGVWYRDPELLWEFRVLAVHPETVDVVDRSGVRREVNRMLWEDEMEVLTDAVR